MEGVNFTSPLQAVQVIPMFTYLSILSDFLFLESYLNEGEQDQPIPIVNALYNYFYDDSNDRIKNALKKKDNYERYGYDTYDQNYNILNSKGEKIKIVLLDDKNSANEPKYYNYKISSNQTIDKKLNLARKLIAGTDLYGSKPNEIPDTVFVDALYKHIITTLVFEKYTNINNFLVQIVRTSKDLKITQVYESIVSKLAEEKFLNENGCESKLEELAIVKIMEEFIYPLFPKPPREMDLLSIDYIYAQAGSIFYHSAKSQSLMVPEFGENVNGNLTEDQFNEYIATAHAIEQSVITKNINETALGIFTLPALLYYASKEGKTEAKNRTEGEFETKNRTEGEFEIKNQTKGEFETKNQTEGESETKSRTEGGSETKNRNKSNGRYETKNTGTEAFRMLFQYLNDSYQRIEEAKDNDYKYQFYSALSNFKNRTTLAREMIRKMCPFVEEDKLEDEAETYKNNHDTYKCKTGTKWETLVDINQVYDKQVEKVVDKFFRYEKESIRDAFGSEAIESMDAGKLVITRGHITHNSVVGGGRMLISYEYLRESDDLLQFYYPDNHTSVYYAVIRENNDLSVIYQDSSVPASLGCLSPGSAESNSAKTSSTSASSAKTSYTTPPSSAKTPSTTSPNNVKTSTAESTTILKNSIIHCTSVNFRRKLGLGDYQEFRPHYFYRLKTVNENFDFFVTKIAEDRASRFKEGLKDAGYDQTRREWWKAFGLSLIPFYNCFDGIRTHNSKEAALSCTLDAMLFIPLIGEVGSAISKLTTSVTRSLILSSGTTLRSLAVRTTMRETLTQLSRVVLSEVTHLSLHETLSLSKTFLRCLDPGFELIYTLGKGGFRSLSTLIGKLNTKYGNLLTSLETLLQKTENRLANPLRKLSSYPNVYINSVSKNSGYGYKLLGKQFEMRKVIEYPNEMPVVYNQRIGLTEKEMTCKAINIETRRIKNKILHLEDEYLNRYNEKRLGLEISFHDEIYERSGFPCRRRRSPGKVFDCLRMLRANLRNVRTTFEKEAIDYTNHYTTMPITNVQTQLRKFTFENSKMQLEFVKDWQKLVKEGKTNLPSWSKQYELKNPSLFEKLRYDYRMEEEDLTIENTIDRLDAIYPKGKNCPSSEAADLFRNFNADRAFETVTIEDYFAIREYMGMGYTKIGQNTLEARKMREALYRLAIRQSDDSTKEYSKILYRGERRSSEIIEKLFFSGKKELELNRFTSTSGNEMVANEFQFFRPAEGVSVFYKMKFSQDFLRAKVINVLKDTKEDETILLPGSKFHIDEAKRIMINGREAIDVKLSFNHDAMPKHKWYKKIMDELEKLKNDSPTTYDTDPNSSIIYDDPR